MENEDQKGRCPSCAGKIRPIITCEACESLTLREELDPIREDERCPVCEKTGKIVFECEECKKTFPFAEIVPKENKLFCPMCGAFVDPGDKTCPGCGSSFVVPEKEGPRPSRERPRKRRKVVGEYSEEDIQEIMRIPGVGRLRAEILCKAGYTSLAKLNRASVEELAKVRQIGMRTAKSIKEALQLMYVEPIESQRLLEELIEEEFECPVCKTIVSAYDTECNECGSIFERVVQDEGFVKEIEKLGEEKSSLSLFDMKLLENPEDVHLWVARGGVLKRMGNYEEALRSYDRAIEIEPGLKSAWIAKAEVLSGLGRIEEAASCYREVVDSSATAAGIKFGEEEEAMAALEELAMEECPSCSSPIPPGSYECPSCGRVLLPREEAPALETLEEEALEEVPKEEEERPELAKVPVRVVRGPGLTNGKGMVNGRRKINGTGLVNGKGLVNGRGRVNGLINGNGFINGMSLTELRKARREKMWPRYVALAIALSILALVLYGIVPPAEKRISPITIDGEFEDWQGVSVYHDQNQGQNPNVLITSYGIRLDNGYLSFLFGVQGSALGDPIGYDSFYLFIDIDNDRNTGYLVRELGAEYMVEVFGGENKVAGVPIYEYIQSQDRLNFTNWKRIGSGKAAAGGNLLEVQIAADSLLMLDDSIRMLFHADDYEGSISYSSVNVGPSYGALLVTQKSYRENLVLTETSREILSLRFEAKGADVQVSSVHFEVSGAPEPQLGDFVVKAGTTEERTVVVDTSQAMDGSLISISILSIDCDTPYTIRGSGARAYFKTAPSEPRADGWFGEWAGVQLEDDSDNQSISNPNIDIQRSGTLKRTANDTAHFYLEVRGEVLGGFASPQIRQKVPVVGGEPVQPGPPAAYLPRMGGEDWAYVYVDSNTSDPRDGKLMKGIQIRPDYMIRVRGMYGEIKSVELCHWEPWEPLLWGWNCSPNASAALDTSRMEIASRIPGISSSEISVAFATTDWKHRGDSTEPTTRTIGSRGQLGPEPMAPSWPSDSDWISVVTDADDGFSDPSLEILELYFYMDSTYLYVRIRTESTVAPVLTDNTWWTYIDQDGDGGNDWIVVEFSGSSQVRGYAWNSGLGQWGGTPSDWIHTIVDTDDDSAARSTTMVIGLQTFGCVDFAILRSAIGSIEDDATLAAADSDTEDQTIQGRTERSPGEGIAWIDDWTSAGQIPEFEELLFPILLSVAVSTVIIKRRKRYSRS